MRCKKGGYVIGFLFFCFRRACIHYSINKTLNREMFGIRLSARFPVFFNQPFLKKRPILLDQLWVWHHLCVTTDYLCLQEMCVFTPTGSVLRLVLFLKRPNLFRNQLGVRVPPISVPWCNVMTSLDSKKIKIFKYFL